jgi:hypothetical protein
MTYRFRVHPKTVDDDGLVFEWTVDRRIPFSGGKYERIAEGETDGLESAQEHASRLVKALKDSSLNLEWEE